MQKNKSVLSKTSLLQKASLILLGVFLFTVFLEIGLRAAGSIFLFLQDYRNKVSIRQKGAYRIMCLGESTTLFGGKDSYLAQLERILNERSIGVNFSVINKGEVGMRTSVFVEKLEENLDKYKPDMVITMMGINDGKRYPSFLSCGFSYDAFFKNLRAYKLIISIQQHVLAKIKRARKKFINGYQEMSISNFAKSQTLAEDISGLGGKYNGEYFTNKGRTYFSEGKYMAAEKAFKNALELDPFNKDRYYDLGWFYHGIEVYIKAEETFNKAIELCLGEGWPYFEIGKFYRIRLQYS